MHLNARNTEILRQAKAVFNKAIYKRALEIANRDGIEKAVGYLQAFVRSPLQTFLDEHCPRVAD